MVAMGETRRSPKGLVCKQSTSAAPNSPIFNALNKTHQYKDEFSKMPRPKRIPTKTNTHQIPTPPSSLSHSPVSDAELASLKAQSSVNSLHAQEDHRRLRAQVHISKGETEDVEIRLADEEGTSESLRQDLLRYHQRLNLASEAAQKVNMDLEARSRECETIRVCRASNRLGSSLLTACRRNSKRRRRAAPIPRSF